MEKQGMSIPVVLASIVGLIIIGGIVVTSTMPEEEKMMAEGEEMMKEGEKMVKDGEDMMKGGEKMVKEGEDMMKEKETSMIKDGEVPMEEGEFSGDRISGTPTTPLLEWNKEDYEKALASDRLIVLYFYASWCPTCKAEFPKMEDAFDGLDGENLVGFRVNYKDDFTEEGEEDLAREHGVAYQHTKVFIKNGKRIEKFPQQWTIEDYITNIEANL